MTHLYFSLSRILVILLSSEYLLSEHYQRPDMLNLSSPLRNLEATLDKSLSVNVWLIKNR